jgi:dTMP kinase
MIEGHFIVIEGIDGAGTSTQTALLGKWFRGCGLPVHTTHEPTEGPIGSIIRQVLTHRLVVCGMTGPRAPTWATMALLFAADRLDHVESLILPNLMDGVTVVSDRYDLSSIAYQSATAPESVDGVEAWVRTINARARRPDLTIVLDVDPAEAALRRQDRSCFVELYEDSALQRTLAEAYTHAERLVPGDKVLHIDGNRDVARVHADVVAAVRALRGEPDEC